MRMHFGLIAAKAPLSEFRAAFFETWPDFEVATSADGFATVDDVWAWKSANERVLRMIQNIDGEVTSSGDALLQEKDIDVASYYVEETEQLMQAFGLSKPEDLPVASTTLAIATIDRTDYSHLLAGFDDGDVTALELPSQGAKPWWKFW
jgi:hypothetical protein